MSNPGRVTLAVGSDLRDHVTPAEVAVVVAIIIVAFAGAILWAIFSTRRRR